MDKDANKMKTT